MQKINISAISYSNSVTFLYGLLNSPVINDINLMLDIPAVCADKVLNGTADMGLMPIVETLRLKQFEIVSDLCIGADDYVKTVLLISNQPVEKLKRIYLDYQSRTSVTLIKVLAKYHWMRDFEWIPAVKGFENLPLDDETGAVLIGDRTFSAHSIFRYDLAHEWKLLTGLPFVFAAWVSNRNLDRDFCERFNQALYYGIEHIEEAAAYYKARNTIDADIVSYLRENISYPFDERKKQGMESFLQYAREFI